MITEKIKRRIALRLRSELVKAAPSDKGLLRSSIKVIPTATGLRIITNETGKFVEFGTNPHIIKPKKKGALAFKGPNGTVITKKVMHPGCFLNPNVKVITNKGKKYIKDIKKGDMVLTHNNRYKKVLEKLEGSYKKEQEYYEIKSSFQSKISVTPEHKVLTCNNGKKEWKNASDIKLDDEIFVLVPKSNGKINCGICNRGINSLQTHIRVHNIKKDEYLKKYPDHYEYFDSNKKLNDMSRNAGRKKGFIPWNKGRKETRKWVLDKISNGSKGRIISDDTRKKLSIAQRKRFLEGRSNINDLHVLANRALAKNKYSTKIEKNMEKYLKSLKKTFVSQFIIKINPRRILRVDFYIKKEKHFIETDGQYWHQDKEKDRKRDFEILSRYPDHKISHVVYGKDIIWEEFDLNKLKELRYGI